MIKRKFICIKCDYTFEVDISEEEEKIKERKTPRDPIVCPRCGNPG
jgi:ribosomal protein S27AE